MSFLLCGVLLLWTAACSDPTSVGEGIGNPPSGGSPVTQAVTPADPALSLRTATSPSRTGGPPATTRGTDPWRFLAGVVEDPVAGRIAANGYVDFSGTAVGQDSIADRSADDLDVSLRVRPTYHHGDTTATLSLTLFALSGEPDLNGGTDPSPPADTSFDVEPGAIDVYSLSPTGPQSLTDTLVTFSLPQAWVSSHLSALQDSSGRVGFKLQSDDRPGAGDRKAIVGFEHGSATLRVATEEDTVDFDSRTSFTHIERRTPPANPDPSVYALLQDGLGTELVMEWAFDQPPLDTLSTRPLNQAAITVPVDTARLEEVTRRAAGPTYVQPIADSYRFFGTRRPDGPSCPQVGLTSRLASDDTCVLPTAPQWSPSEARVTSETAFNVFDQSFRDTPPFTSLSAEIAVKNDPNLQPQGTIQQGLPSTLPALVDTSTANGTTETLPRAILTTTPL